MNGNITSEAPGNGNDPGPEPYLYSLPEAARMLGGITERELYNRFNAGDLESVKIGRRRFVVRESIVEYIGRLRGQRGAA